MAETLQEFHDRFYWQHGPCCAGCDWWHAINSVVGECHASSPASGEERVAMLGIENCSLPSEAGHVFTLYMHHCGAFKDEFDWSSLPLPYQRRIGAKEPSDA